MRRRLFGGGGSAATKTKQLGCHDTKTQKKNLHHREHPTRRFTFGPHGTSAAGAAGAAEDWKMGQREHGGGSDGGAWSGGGCGPGAAPATKGGRMKEKTRGGENRPGHQRHRDKELGR